MRQRGTPLRYWRATLVIVQMRQTRSNPAKNKQGLLCPLWGRLPLHEVPRIETRGVVCILLGIRYKNHHNQRQKSLEAKKCSIQ
jgi:hypothetical protein